MARRRRVSAEESGESLVAGNGRALQQRRDGTRHLFGKERKQTFLEHLAATCNVTAAAEAAGVNLATPYVHRMKDREFAEKWWLALEQGAAKLVALRLQREVERAEELVLKGDMPPDERTPIDLMKLITQMREISRGLSGGETRRGRPVEVASLDETCKALAKRLRAFGVREGVEPHLRVATDRLKKP
jgi:hypothetical protein